MSDTKGHGKRTKSWGEAVRVILALPTSPPAPEPHRCVRLGGDGDSCAACNNIGTHPPAPEKDK